MSIHESGEFLVLEMTSVPVAGDGWVRQVLLEGHLFQTRAFAKSWCSVKAIHLRYTLIRFSCMKCMMNRLSMDNVKHCKVMWWPMSRELPLGCWLSWVGPYQIASKMSSWKSSDGWGTVTLTSWVELHGYIMEMSSRSWVLMASWFIYRKTVHFLEYKVLNPWKWSQRSGMVGWICHQRESARKGSPTRSSRQLRTLGSISVKTCHRVILGAKILPKSSHRHFLRSNSLTASLMHPGFNHDLLNTFWGLQWQCLASLISYFGGSHLL